jgi:hypothetical protein
MSYVDLLKLGKRVVEDDRTHYNTHTDALLMPLTVVHRDLKIEHRTYEYHLEHVAAQYFLTMALLAVEEHSEEGSSYLTKEQVLAAFSQAITIAQVAMEGIDPPKGYIQDYEQLELPLDWS